MIAIGYARHFDSATAIRQCSAALPKGDVRMLMVFCGGKHDPVVVLSALRAAFGPIPIVGGSAAGAICRDASGYSGLEIGVAAFIGPALVPQVLAEPGLDVSEQDTGYRLGRRAAAVASDGALVLLLFDSVARTQPLRLHPASDLVRGVSAGLGAQSVQLVGGGLLTDMNLSDGWVFDGEVVTRHAAVALVFPPQVGAAIAILHGCRPVSTFMDITRIDGAEVFELDGRPALAVIEQMLGLPLGGSQGQDLSLIATLGEKQGDPFAPYEESAYVNRLILSANRAAGSITLFEPDFQRGTRVQIMARDNGLMLDSVREGIAGINRLIAARDPLFALYIDCAGRASARSGATVEEADLVRQSLPPGLPLLGFYSGVEVAPFDGYSRPLDWTGVIAVLCRTP